MASDIAIVNAVIRDIYHATSRASLQEYKETALALLKRVIAFDAAKWGVGRLEGDRVVIHSMHLHNLPPELMPAWEDVESHDVLAHTICRYPGHAVRMSDLLSREELRTSELYRKYGERFDLEHSLSIALIDERTNLLEGIGLYRTNDDMPFSDRERYLLDIIAPHLIESHCLVQFSELRRNISASLRSIPAALCDRFGVLHEAEPRFVDLLQREWPCWQGSQLPTPLSEAIASGYRLYIGQAICFNIDAVQELFVLSAKDRDVLEKLSPRQRAIAIAVANGLTYKEVAIEFGISPSTVTNHMNAIYKRLGITRNVHLAQLIRNRRQ